jgi:hypothetical protein
MHTDESGPLTKDEFLSQCQVRNPKFRADLLTLWQALPPVLREAPTTKRTPRKVAFLDGQPIRDDRRKVDLPSFWTPCGQVYRVAHIKTQGELASAELTIRLALSTPDPLWHVLDLFEAEYSQCTGVSARQRDEILEAHRQKWPRWSVGRLRRPHVPLWWSARPSIVVGLSVAQHAGFLGDLPQGVEPAAAEEVFQAAPLMIPVYEDTRKEDLDWEDISKWQERVYGKKRRTREDLRTLLDIWDRVNGKGDRIPEIARDLRQAISTVRSKYFAVNAIILQGLDKDEAEAALAATPKIAKTWADCPECMALYNTGRIELCRKHEAWVNAGAESQREVTANAKKIESIEHARARKKTGRRPAAQ